MLVCLNQAIVQNLPLLVLSQDQTELHTLTLEEFAYPTFQSSPLPSQKKTAARSLQLDRAFANSSLLDRSL